MTLGGPIALPPAQGALVWVAALVNFDAADLGNARVVPVAIPDGLGASHGDRIEVDAATAARWIAAGVAQATS